MLHPGQVGAIHRASAPVLKAAASPATQGQKAPRRTSIIYTFLAFIVGLEIWHLASSLSWKPQDVKARHIRQQNTPDDSGRLKYVDIFYYLLQFWIIYSMLHQQSFYWHAGRPTNVQMNHHCAFHGGPHTESRNVYLCISYTIPLCCTFSHSPSKDVDSTIVTRSYSGCMQMWKPIWDQRTRVL